jgi:hypothetical protein
MPRPIPCALSVRVSDDLFHAGCAVFAYWWSPLDGTMSTANGFVGMLPPPALYAERLALSLRGGF